MLHPAVAQAAAIGIPHERWVERPLLVVVKQKDQDVTKEALREFLESKLVKWWLPDAIEFVDALPIGPTGKVLKRTLREKFANHKL
jgi:fatty-acyl-CoA synthase